jgi:hypothetical protein
MRIRGNVSAPGEDDHTNTIFKNQAGSMLN